MACVSVESSWQDVLCRSVESSIGAHGWSWRCSYHYFVHVRIAAAFGDKNNYCTINTATLTDIDVSTYEIPQNCNY